MQDEINEKVIALSIRTTKLTAEMLQKSIRFMLSQIKKQLDKPVQHHGKQTLKQLMKQNAGVSSIEITDSNIKSSTALTDISQSCKSSTKPRKPRPILTPRRSSRPKNPLRTCRKKPPQSQRNTRRFPRRKKSE